MTRDITALPDSQVRRADRAVLDDAWIAEQLRRAPTGVIATVFDGRPFVNSNLFVYDEAAHALYFHTANLGRTRTNVEAEQRVCFTVFSMGRLLPADEALEFSVEYTGVVVFGRAAVIEDQAEATYALQLLLDKYFPHLRPERDYRGITPEELKRTTAYRITIEEWSGKKKEVAEDFPGAFHWLPLNG
jgi:nitroimidazol reductase NimA-like FMN-containing flavoprotein (pyridoxamine 5'-phosphate oxidase superfamily)